MAKRKSSFVDMVDGRPVIVIPSRTHGKLLVLIDEAAVPLVGGVAWCVQKSHRKRTGEDVFYVFTNRPSTGTKKKQYLHRLLTQAGRDEVVDHINGDPLDNRRENLRKGTAQENAQNATRAKGYCWFPRDRRWAAWIRLDGKNKHLGYFDREEDARAAYVSARLSRNRAARYRAIPAASDS